MSHKVIGIIGCGIIADTHVETVKEVMPGADICVCDPLPGKAALLRKKYGLKRGYTSIGAMLLKEDLFSVHVLSPPQLHVEHTMQCLEAGCHVLVEKPLAFRSEDVDKLYAAARKYSRTLCVDHSLFYQPSVLKMFEKLHVGTEEKVLHINCFYGLDMAGSTFELAPKGHWKLGLPGGAIVDTIIHPVTLAVEMTRKPVDMKVRLSGPSHNPGEVHISWQGEKAMASITVSSKAQPFRRTTEITTTRHTFVIDHSTETLVSLNAGFGPKSLRKLLKNFAYGYQLIKGTIGTVIQVLRGKLKQNPGARGVIANFYRYLDGEEKLPVSEENVRNSTFALEKIIEGLSQKIVKEADETKEDGRNRSYEPKSKAGSRILVTGASGFLGSRICEIISADGSEVVAQVRRGPNADKLQGDNLHKIFEDFNFEPVNYDNLVKDVQAIVHCTHAAGANTWEEVKRVNVDATVALYEAGARAGCGGFIFLSSVAVYGVHQRGHITVNEDTPISSGNSKWDFYIRSKTMAERALLERARKGGPRLLIIRPGVLYSANGLRLARKSVQLRDSKLLIVFGNGKNHTPFTRVDVLAEAICKALDLDPFPQGIYNMTGNPEETTKEFIYDRMKRLGVTCKFFSMPAIPWRLLASLMEYTYTLTGRRSPPKITRYIIDSSTRDMHYDCSKAEKDLGWDTQKAIEI